MPATTTATDWCFTDNHCSDALPEHYTACKDAWPGLVRDGQEDLVYMVIGFEEASTGQCHHQGFVQFEQPQSFDDLKALWPSIHWEQRKGSPSQASTYCMKDEVYEEWGEIRLSQ